MATGLKTQDEGLYKKSKHFLDLYESEWAVYSTGICIQFKQNRSKPPQELPLANDIRCLRDFCQEEMAKFIGQGDV